MQKKHQPWKIVFSLLHLFLIHFSVLHTHWNGSSSMAKFLSPLFRGHLEKTSFISKHSIPLWYFDWHDVRTKILQNINKPVSTKYKNLVVVRIYKMSEASSSILLRYMSNNLRCMISHWWNEIFFAKISHKNKKNCP